MTQSGPECQICAPRPCHCPVMIQARTEQWLIREMRTSIREVLRHIHEEEVNEAYICGLLNQWMEDMPCPIKEDE